MPKEAIELLEICKKRRYWDWNPSFFIGFDYFYFLHDNLAASRHLMEGSRLPKAPLLLGMLGARLAHKSGQTETAIIFLKSMYETADNEETKKQIGLRIEALTGVLVLEKGIQQFQEKFGSPPKKLEELATTGILEKLPQNPYQTPYTYENGQIGF